MIIEFVNVAVAAAAAIGSFVAVLAVFGFALVFSAKALHSKGKKAGYWE